MLKWVVNYGRVVYGLFPSEHDAKAWAEKTLGPEKPDPRSARLYWFVTSLTEVVDRSTW